MSALSQTVSTDMPNLTLSELDRECSVLVSSLGYRRIARVVERPDCLDLAFQSERGWLVFIRCAATDQDVDIPAMAEMSRDLMFFRLILLRPTGAAYHSCHGRAVVVSTHGDWREELRRILTEQ